MVIIINEIKKMFNLKSLGVLVIGLFIIQFLFISFHIEYFPNGGMKYNYDVHVDMVKKYGNTIDDNEIKDFQRFKAEKLQEADNYLQSNEDFIKSDIDTYEKFSNIDGRNEEASKLMNEVMFEENKRLFWELQELRDIDVRYLDRSKSLEVNYRDLQGKRDESVDKRINYLLENNKYNSTMPYMVFENYNDLLKGFTLAIVFSIIVLLCSIFVGDSSKEIDNIQYTCKIGRNIFRKKIISGIVASLSVTTIGIITMLVVYRQNNTSMFLNCDLNGPYNFIFWFDMTFKQYIILTIGFMYIIGVVTALISMFISSMSKLVVASVVIHIVVGVVLIKLIFRLIQRNIQMFSYFMYFEIGILVLLIVGSILAVIFKGRKERKLDIA